MIAWENIDTVLLDMDGTLLDLHFDNYVWIEAMPLEYARIHNTSVDQAKKYIKENIKKHSGSLNAYCFSYWKELLNFDLMKIHRQEKHRIQYRPYTEIFLKALKNLNLNIFILTNAHPEGIELKLSNTNLAQYVDEIYTSHQYGFAKEQSGFWEAISKEIQFEPDKTVFIDDNLASLRAAKRHGITHLYAISKPCSQSPAKETEEFIAIDNFRDIIPQATPSQFEE